MLHIGEMMRNLGIHEELEVSDVSGIQTCDVQAIT